MKGESHGPGFGPAESANADALIRMALAEDLGDRGDITSFSTIPADRPGAALFVARTEGVVCGLPIAVDLASRFGLEWEPFVVDGTRIHKGDRLARIAGPMRSILSMERTALNFLQRLSGVATMTALYVAEVVGTRATILDTRKTTPGWRMLEKYAVRCGGGRNHRIGLFDAVLIKDNHLAALGDDPDPIALAIRSAREGAPDAAFVEVEVDSLEQFECALAAGADIILLDNLGADSLVEAVRRRDASGSKVLLEASGGITLANLAALARSGVDRISVGALTHSAPALDIALDYDEASAP